MISGQHARRPTTQQLESLQRRLADFNRQRHAPVLVSAWEQRLELEHAARILEGRIVEGERAKVSAVAASAPTQPREFVDWFEQLRDESARQSQRFFQFIGRRGTA